MTIPVLPGWGDALAEHLPRLAQALGGIIAPQHMQEVQLRKAIQQDPRLLSSLATITKDNPEGIAKIFGPHVASFLSALNESPEAQIARTKSTATATALRDPNVASDAGLLGAAGQTSAQRRTGEAQATGTEISVEQKQLLRDALSHVQQTNPEMYSKLSQVGALHEYFNTDQNTETVKSNQADAATADMAARSRVNAILGMDPKELYRKFQKGEVAVGDLGNAFQDPRSAMLKVYFDQQMSNEHDAFLLQKQAQMQSAQDARQTAALTAAEKRQQERLDAEAAKTAEANKKVQERQIAYNNVSINRFVAGTQDKSGKRMSPEQINASLPQVNELLKRNQIMKDLDPETAPQFVAQKSGGFFGMGAHTSVQLMNPDGTPNADYNKETKTTTAPAGQQNKSDTTSTRELSQRGNKAIYDKLDAGTKKIVDTVRGKNISRSDLVSSQAYQSLSLDQKNKVIQALGY